jgi:hypothetical protein
MFCNRVLIPFGAFHLHCNTMRKRGVLQLALQLNFWVVDDICNSMYLYAMSVNGQVA